MARSSWKFVFFSKSIVRKLFLKKISKLNPQTLTLARNSSIPKSFSNKKWYVHNGLKFTKIKTTFLKTGYKFGEFSFTRKSFFFPKKEKKKKHLIRR